MYQAAGIKNSGIPIQNNQDAELGVYNPYSKIVCFVLYLYSSEFGSPPLYKELNRIARDKDYDQLQDLGALMKVMNSINLFAEQNRMEHDKIETGEQIR